MTGFRATIRKQVVAWQKEQQLRLTSAQIQALVDRIVAAFNQSGD